MNTQEFITIPLKPRRSEAKSRVARTTRRGNTLVLVAGILVLLVIIATSYLTTTQSQRSTSSAQQAAAQRDDNAEVIGEMIAQHLADALFVWPIDLDDPALDASDSYYTGIADANFPRKRPDPDARRYGVDPNFGYNFAPYHTVPFTNWPDWTDVAGSDAQVESFFNPRLMPAGPGNLFDDTGGQAGDGGGFNFVTGMSTGSAEPAIAAVLSAESNPLGNPGFGDSRWLRDTEPVRWDTSEYGSDITPGTPDAFSHWRKLSNIASANNGWRIVWDISDVDNHIFNDMNVPVEQWLQMPPRTTAAAPAPLRADTGGTNAVNVLGANPGNDDNLFWRQWRAWFNASRAPFNEITYDDVLSNGFFGAPPNLYKLNDLNATGVIHDGGSGGYVINGIPQDTPDAEFVRGTARHTVSRVLTDTTGDGFTDSFWFLSPAPVRGGIRQVVGVSIVDNSSRLNANVATRFRRNDPTTNWHERKTRGHTPADLALVGQMDQTGGDNTWNVGFYDNPANWADNSEDGIGYTQTYSYQGNNSLRWHRHLEETGLPGVDQAPEQQQLSAEDRLDYWQYSGRLGLSYHKETKNSPSGFTYRPFGLSDELELRMFEGNNNPWAYTRYEYTTHGTGGPPYGPMQSTSTGFLRAGAFDQESSEYMDQLNNRELVRDNRRKLTLYSGARNDLSPPAVWWENRFDDSLPDWYGLPAVVRSMFGSPPANWNGDTPSWNRYIVRNYREQSRLKLDLREPDYWYHGYDNREPDYSTHDVFDTGRLNLRDRLAPALLSALTDNPDELGTFGATPTEYGSYYGHFHEGNYNEEDGNLNKTRRLAAAFAANILAYRSNQPQVLADMVELPGFGRPGRGPGQGRENYLPPASLEGIAGSGNRAYLGVEPQPFLVEAFVAHVYQPTATVPTHFWDVDAIEAADLELPDDFCNTTPGPEFEPFTVEYENDGEHLIFDDPAARSVILVVQIANPFDVPIDLWEYRLRAFGNDTIELRMVLPEENRWLHPATDDQPRTAIFYAIKDTLDGGQTHEIRAPWLDFLDILLTDYLLDVAVAANNEQLAEGTMVVNLSSVWNVEERENYDNYSPDDVPGAIELAREMENPAGAPMYVVVDRFANGSEDPLHGAVRRMGEYAPRERPDVLCTLPPLEGEEGDADDGYYPAYAVSSDSDHWIQWVRVTRAWGVDVNGNGINERHESNPRFVFGDTAVVVPTSAGTPLSSRYERPRSPETGEALGAGDGEVAMGANVYDFADNPNGALPPPVRPDPWFSRKYYAADGRLMDEDPSLASADRPARKPTFFDMNLYDDPRSELGMFSARSYPDKGWYGQFSLEREDPVNYSPPDSGGDNDGFVIIGSGGSQLVSGAGRLNGVDDFTVLDDTTLNMDGTSVSWLEPRVRMFRQPFAMQMTQKNKVFPYWEWLEDHTSFSSDEIDEIRRNRDFEQVGELLNVWLFGHELALAGGSYDRTETTFAEFMSGEHADLTGLPVRFEGLSSYRDWKLNGEAARVNRLRITPQTVRDVAGTNRVVGMVINRPLLASAPTPEQWERYSWDERHGHPAVPAGARVLDMFVCDGPGRWPYEDDFDAVPPLAWVWDDLDLMRFYNANAFSGRMTPGLININTATPEVMRALPHMTRIVGEWPNTGSGVTYPFEEHPFPKIPEAIVRYRDRVGAPIWDNTIGLPDDIGPAYAHRGRTQDFFADPVANDNAQSRFVPGMRGDRGFATLGELSLLTQSGRSEKRDFGTPDVFLYEDMGPQPNQAFLEIDLNSSWRMDYALMPDREMYRRDFPNYFLPGAPQNPNVYLFHAEPDFQPTDLPTVGATSWSARISTATTDRYEPNHTIPSYPVGMNPDTTAEDIHEANLLLAGISNLVTTRSDTFTVHFRVRSFRQNPVTGVWDATDPEHIVDDTRFVMLVDRSNVNSPSDKPRILYLEKLPK